jgi:hypothetical protein
MPNRPLRSSSLKASSFSLSFAPVAQHALVAAINHAVPAIEHGSCGRIPAVGIAAQLNRPHSIITPSRSCSASLGPACCRRRDVGCWRDAEKRAFASSDEGIGVRILREMACAMYRPYILLTALVSRGMLASPVSSAAGMPCLPCTTLAERTNQKTCQ